MAKKSWIPLKKGDVVDLVAPGFRCSDEELQKAVQFLENWQLRPRVAKKIFGEALLCSQNLKIRTELLIDALQAKDSQGVWCVRGGYGSLPMAPALLKAKLKGPKLFVGLSDITTLDVILTQKFAWSVLHGPLLDRLGSKPTDENEVELLRQVVFGETKQVDFPSLLPLNGAAKKIKSLRAPVTGGNLVVLQSTIGTPHQVSFKGKFLFLEDTGERGYKVDRILHHFEQAKMLQGVKALLFGEFVAGDEPHRPGVNFVWPVIEEFCKSRKIPAFKGVQNGHGFIQRPLPLGPVAQLKSSAHGFHLMVPTGARFEKP